MVNETDNYAGSVLGASRDPFRVADSAQRQMKQAMAEQGYDYGANQARPERELERLCAMLDRADTTLDSALRELMAHLGRISGEDCAQSGAAGVAGPQKPGESFNEAHMRAERLSMLADKLRDQINRLDAI